VVNQEHPEGGAGASQTPAAAPVFKGAARRRFTKAGAVAAGAMLTLKSQPGLAANPDKCIFASPSAAGSFAINRSRAPQVGSCEAKSHGYWKNWPNEWPRMQNPKSSSHKAVSMWNLDFDVIFPCALGSPFYGQPMGTVIGWGGGGAQEVARHCIAAYLNAFKGYTSPYLTTAQVIDIWNGYNSAGGYRAIKPNGRVWSEYDIANYIKGTWGDGTMLW
jgi:hypothetical protein